MRDKDPVVSYVLAARCYRPPIVLIPFVIVTIYIAANVGVETLRVSSKPNGPSGSKGHQLLSI